MPKMHGNLSELNSSRPYLFPTWSLGFGHWSFSTLNVAMWLGRRVVHHVNSLVADEHIPAFAAEQYVAETAAHQHVVSFFAMQFNRDIGADRLYDVISVAAPGDHL